MALFFDQGWFDTRLAERGLDRMAVSAILRLSPEEVAEIWKDQRELAGEEVALLAELLGVTAEEIVKHAGVATPLPKTGAGDLAAVTGQLREISERLDRLERMMLDIKDLLLDQRGR